MPSRKPRSASPALVAAAAAVLLAGCGAARTASHRAPAAPATVARRPSGAAPTTSSSPATSPAPQQQAQAVSGFFASSPSPPSVPAAAEPPLVPFKGQVQAIFFHPLIVYPSLAFDHDSLAQGYRDWFITVKEFKRMLPQLYAHHFVLVDVHDLYALQKVDGRTVVRRKTLWVPKGKKPLLLSIDDLNYYRYMRQNGNSYKLVLNKQGQVATYSVSPAGKVVISRQNGIIPLLNQFVAAHPDFSLDGAKGMINETGYQGVLGYRTQPGAPHRQQAIRAVKPIIARLKATGWIFASHSWGHRDDATISYAALVWDTQHWENQVEPLVGKTDLYVYPFGAELKPGSRKIKYMVSQGFHVFFGVGPHPYWRWYANYVALDRVHVDGLALRTQHAYLAPFFNASTVIDRQARGLP